MSKILSIIFGGVFVLVGILGFIPNPIVGQDAIFITNVAHNLVHLITGSILLLVGLKASQHSALVLRSFGILYPLLAFIGFALVPNGGDLLGYVETNLTDHWLHVILGLALFAGSFA